MAKEFEILDSLVQSQKEFMETWMNTQKELWERMAESTRKMQDAMLGPLCSTPFQGRTGEMGDPQATQKEAFNIYNTMVDTMVNTSKVYTDQVIKMQEAWRHTIDKQMEIGRRMNTNLFEMGRHVAEEAGRRQAEGTEEAAA
jgi:hypothetical protein